MPIAIIPLDDHNLLSHALSLFHSTKAQHVSEAGICLLVSVRHTHATAGSDVEASKIAVLIYNGDKAEVVREEVDIVAWWYSNSDFELEDE